MPGYENSTFVTCHLISPAALRLGDVLNLTAPTPFAPDPFQVQCLASNGNAPIYELTDYSAVSCIEQDPSGVTSLFIEFQSHQVRR